MPDQDPRDPSVRLMRRLYGEAADQALEGDDEGPPGVEAARLAAVGQDLARKLAAAVAEADGDEVEVARVAGLSRPELLAELTAQRAARGEPFDQAAWSDATDEDLRRAVRVLRRLPPNP